MLRQAELWRVLGRYLTDKLIEAKWIIPVRDQNGNVRFDKRGVHRALTRLRRHGTEIDGHLRPIVTPPAKSSKKRERDRDPLADLNLESKFFETELR